eukprot:17459-Heterococcus_DN1.PRE.4
MVLDRITSASYVTSYMHYDVISKLTSQLLCCSQCADYTKANNTLCSHYDSYLCATRALCSSRVRNKLRQLRQQLPDVIFAVLPGENMRETGVTHALDDSQSVQYSFTTHLFIVNFIFGIILKVPRAQQWTIDNMLANMCATGMLYMIVYLAQKGVTLTDWPSDQQQQCSMFMTISYYVVRPPAWCMLKIWCMLSTLTRFVIGAEVKCIVAIVLRKCCCLIVRQRAHVIHIANDTLHLVIQEGIVLAIRRLSKTKYAYTRDIMTTCTRCHESIATAVNTPCGHTFLCWSCAEQYRDEHGDICNSCYENSILVKLQQQQMCVICLEHVSGHDLFHIQQCGHQICITDAVDYVKAMLRDASSSITHEGIKCPSLECDRLLTLEDVRTLSKASIAPQKLTETDYSRIEVFIQDAQVLHSAPADAIVYCSLCFTCTFAAQMSTSAQQVMHQNCSQLLTIKGIQSRSNTDIKTHLQQRGGQHDGKSEAATSNVVYDSSMQRHCDTTGSSSIMHVLVTVINIGTVAQQFDVIPAQFDVNAIKNTTDDKTSTVPIRHHITSQYQAIAQQQR